MKEDKVGIVVIIVLIALTGLIVSKIINYINSKEKTYEFAKNGEIYESEDCYLKDEIDYCKYNDMYIQVDNYYEVE